MSYLDYDPKDLVAQSHDTLYLDSAGQIHTRYMFDDTYNQARVNKIIWANYDHTLTYRMAEIDRALQGLNPNSDQAITLLREKNDIKYRFETDPTANEVAQTTLLKIRAENVLGLDSSADQTYYNQLVDQITHNQQRFEGGSPDYKIYVYAGLVLVAILIVVK